MSAHDDTDRQPVSPRAGADSKARDVADFYERLVFPSRSSHPEYSHFVSHEAGERVGDLGCGQSLFYDTLRDYKPIPVFLDLSMAALRTIDYGARVRGNLFQLPFANAIFDRLLCVGVVHHLPEPLGALEEMARVLKRGGTLVLGVYAPGTIQARLRMLHNASRNIVWRAAVVKLTEQLIRTRHAYRGHTLKAEDVQLRARDFLEVPFVRYIAPEFFIGLAASAGLSLLRLQRISGMNILVFERQ